MMFRLSEFRADRLWLPALLAFLVACSSPPANPAPDVPAQSRTAIEAAIESIAADAIAKGPLVGLSIAVARDGDEVIADAWGWLDRDAGIPATAGTTFNYESVTKPFTALAILTLVDSGRLRLDDRLQNVLPEFPVPAQGARITVRQLLNHTSGLNDYVQADLERWRATGEPLDRAFVLDWLAERPLDFEPGVAWSYNNSAFYLAGMIVERVSGMAFPEYLRQAVTGPLGLASIEPCDDQPIRPRTRGYTVGEGERPAESAMYIEAGVVADGGLCGTAADLVRLPAALRGSGLLSEASLAAFLEDTMLRDGTRVAYGLGTRQGELEGRRVWGHTGGSTTYVAKLARYEDDGVSIAVLTNTLEAETDPLVIEGSVAASVLGLLPPETPEAAITAEAAATYLGTYTTGRWGNAPARFRIFHEDGQLVRGVTVDGDERLTPLVPRGGHRFGRSDWPRDRLVFHVIDGRASGFSEFYNGMFGSYNRRVDR